MPELFRVDFLNNDSKQSKTKIFLTVASIACSIILYLYTIDHTNPYWTKYFKITPSLLINILSILWASNLWIFKKKFIITDTSIYWRLSAFSASTTIFKEDIKTIVIKNNALVFIQKSQKSNKIDLINFNFQQVQSLKLAIDNFCATTDIVFEQL